MGPYLFANAILVGFFAFGAIYHGILWSRARRDGTVFTVALLCVVSAVNSYAAQALVSAATVADAQRALDLRAWAAASSVVVLTWLFGLIAGVSARWFVWPVTAILTAMSVRGLLGTPLTGHVTNVQRVAAPWGEMLSVVERGGASPLLLVVAYGLALTVPMFGLWCARRLWPRDRVGSVLLSVAAVALLASGFIGMSADLLRSPLPYVGPLVAAVWILPIAWQVARRNQQRDDELRRSEARFRFLIQHQAEFVVSCGPDARLSFVNDSFSRFFGLTPEQAVGASLLELFPPDDRTSLSRRIAELTADQPMASGEWQAIDRNGQPRWTQWTISGVFDQGPAAWQLQLTGRDIHDRVVAEEAKDRLERQLLQAQKLEALGQLAGGVAHDFNNLLTVIAAHTELLLTDGADPSRHDELTQIQLAAERAAAMTRQLLAFGRQSVLEPRVIDVNTVVGRAATMLRRSIGETIELVVRTTASHRVRADPDQLVRVLLNLAINARDAMPDGGRLIIETDDATVDPGSGRTASASAGEHVQIVVRDFGSGMSNEVKAKLFEPFFTTKGQGKGTGLGLAVVDGIIRQSGGWIDVDSAPGAGTTFRIFLPAVSRAVEADAPIDPTPSHARGHEVVLLVEDQTAVREVTVAALERHGYIVLPAAGGAEALDIVRARQTPVDLVLTDVVMPGMSGPQLVERLRGDQPGLRALFMSGYVADATVRPTDAGLTGFIQKPFTAATLGAKLRQVLDPE